MEENKNKLVLTVSALILVTTVALYGVFRYMRVDNSSPVNIETPVLPDNRQNGMMSGNRPAGMMRSSVYKDGAYSSSGSYDTPGGTEQVSVQVLLKNDVVLSSIVTPEAKRPTAVRYQKIFTDNYKTQVIGKKIDEILLDKVSGSSLTSAGFNDALAKIKQQAKA